MVTQNPAFQVLVVSDNAAILTAGLTIDQLAPGQIGLFSYATNLAIDGTVPSANKSFYMAVGVDRLAAGTIQDVNKSAGANIEKKGIRAFTYKPYTASQNKKILLNVGKVACNVEYGVKFEIRSELAYRNYGFNVPSKTFTAFSNPCSDTCVDCAAGDPASVVAGLATELGLDPDKIFTTRILAATPGIPALAGAGTGGTLVASTYYVRQTAIVAGQETTGSPEASAVTSGTTSSIVVTGQAVEGTGVTYRTYIGTVAGAEGQYFTSTTPNITLTTATGTGGTVPTVNNAVAVNGTALEITINADPLRTFAQININYIDPRQVNAIMSILTDPNTLNGNGSFGPDTTQTDILPLIYEDGAGYDIQQLEYIAGGWNGKPGPYRTSELVGVPTGFFEYFALTNGQYNVYSLMYENRGIGGGQKYDTSLQTIIAVPTANTTALNSLNAALERIINDAVGNDTTVDTAFPIANQEEIAFE